MSTSFVAGPPPVAAPARKPRRWWRVALVVVALVILVPLGFWGYTHVTTRSAWSAAVAEAELDVPRWRLLELEEDRPEIPDAANSALHMMTIRRNAGTFNVSIAPNYEKIFEKLPPTAQLNNQQTELIRTRLALIPKHLEEARKLKDMPRGRLPITYSDDGISTLIPHHQEVRQFAEWLQHDAYLRTQDEEYDKAVESCQAILVASRVFETDPFLIAFLIRISLQEISTATLERVMAQSYPGEESLKAMQAALDRDIQSSSWLQAVRGERAMMNHLFENIRAGKVKPGWLGVMSPRGYGTTFESFNLWVADRFPSLILKYYPEFLGHMNRCVDIGKLPAHERIVQLKEWEDSSKTTKNPVIRMLASAMTKCHQAECRSQMHMRSAMVALACERYRLRHKNHEWPASLDVLVQEKLLDAIPTDPMDNQPLRYRKTKDGIVIYSIGFDKIDGQGNIDREKIYEPGIDLGFRLWNVDRRRQKALPPVVFAEGEGVR